MTFRDKVWDSYSRHSWVFTVCAAVFVSYLIWSVFSLITNKKIGSTLWLDIVVFIVFAIYPYLVLISKARNKVGSRNPD